MPSYPYKNVIAAWERGEPIQIWSESLGLWVDIDPEHFYKNEYRIKPDSKIFRTKRYLYNTGNEGLQIGIYTQGGWKAPSFVRWIDEEWVEIVV